MYEYEEDNEYVIESNVMDIEINIDKINEVLDKHIDEEDVTLEESETIVLYIMQLFYRDNEIECCTTKVQNKYNMLITSRRMELLNGMGILDVSYSDEKKDFVYSLNDKGLELIDSLREYEE